MNRKGTTLYISSPTNWDKRREVSRHRISQFRLLVDIYSTLCILWVEGEGWKLWQKLNKFIQTAECAIIVILCFHSRGQHLFKFIGTKESVYIRKEFNSHRTGLGHKHGRRFIVLGHKYGRHDVKWKHRIGAIHKVPTKVRDAEESLVYDNLSNNKRITKQHICYMLILWNNTLLKLFQNEGLNKLGWVPA